ncbi:alpha/beta hydrolase fold domain-containing protein [Streptomyces griseochromogenes]|uniref:alpha/beta hydrolase fold domain-containing protein n=1 Tax=Streptomyces griseochromogenes TaxID=68214 RepID=UPI0037B7A94B
MTSTAPAPTDTGWPPPPFLAPTPPLVGSDGVRRFHGLTYARTPGYRPCLLDVHVPDARAAVPAVVWIHGGGWLDGDRRYPPPTVPVELLHGAVLGAGLALVCVDYRHSLEAHFPAQLHDVKAAIRYARRHADAFGIDPERIGAWGESAGGHLAALAGLVRADAHGGALEGREGVRDEDSSVRAVVDWYGVSELVSLLSQSTLPPVPGEPPYPDPVTSLLGGAEEDRLERARVASPVTYAGPATPPPFLLVHGREDKVVPFGQSELLERALARAGAEVTLRAVEGADHIFLGSAEVPAVVTESVDFLRRRLTA